MFDDDDVDDVDKAGRILIHLDPDLMLDGDGDFDLCKKLLGTFFKERFDGNQSHSNPDSDSAVDDDGQRISGEPV